MHRPKRSTVLWFVAVIILLVALAVVLLSSCTTVVEPLALTGPAVTASSVELADFDAVLGRFVDDRGNVDYAALQAAPDDLERFYASVALISPDSHPDLFPAENDRLAYWLNAYNAAAIVSVTRLYPIDSVKEVGVPFYLFFLPDTAGFFLLRLHVFGGESISLYGLENDIVRERFKDPRIHFALNCASAGCPRLPRTHFASDRLDEQLDRETRRFFDEPRNLEVDHGAKTIRLSEILNWYESDYTSWLAEKGVAGPSLLGFVLGYVEGSRAEDVRRAAEAGYRMEFVPYDWRLNDKGLVR